MKIVPKDAVNDVAVLIDDVPVGWVPSIGLSGGVISLHPYVPDKTDPTMSTRLSMMMDRGKVFTAIGAFGAVAFDLTGKCCCAEGCNQMLVAQTKRRFSVSTFVM
jgi:hypothetical protein